MAIVAVIFALICETASITTSVGSLTMSQVSQTAPDIAASRKAQSVADFIAMGRVIESTRCLNCHPADGYPTQADDMHRHTPRITPGPEGKGVPGFTCSQCHGAKNANTSLPHVQSIPGNPKWSLAPHEFAWQHKTLAEICVQFRDPKTNGGRSLKGLHDHVAYDPLVGWAWHPGRGRTPSPGTQAEFGQLTQHWIDTGAACPILAELEHEHAQKPAP